MKRLGGISTILGTSVLYLLFGTAANPAFAQEQEHQEEAKPPHQEAKPAQEAKPPATRQEEAKPKQEKTETRTETTRTETKTTVKHGPVVNGRIPDDKFRASFGRQHTFVINRPVIIEGQPRFQFGGYWFTYSAPWPVAWAYSDGVYIDFIDGQYYLIDPLHPGFQLAIILVL
jgi:hypothetical protein